MSHSIEIIHLTDASHAEILASIMISAWCSAFRGILSHEIIEQYTQRESCAAMFAQILDSGVGTMYLAEQNSQPMGLLYWLPESQGDVRIEALLTIPDAWGKGIGAALMQRALADISASGHSAVHVWPFAQNHRAQRFYAKNGFQATGQTRIGDALELEYVTFLSVSRESGSVRNDSLTGAVRI